MGINSIFEDCGSDCCPSETFCEWTQGWVQLQKINYNYTISISITFYYAEPIVNYVACIADCVYELYD